MRRILAGIAVAALLSACACGAAAQTGMSVVDTSYVLPDGERVLELSIVVPAPLDEAWTAFTTSDGFRSWAAPVARVDLRVGGEIESSYSAGAVLGAPDNIRNEILALVPLRLLVIRNVQAPRSTAFDVTTFQKLQTAVQFAALGPRETRVTVQNSGYRDGALYDGVYKHFKAGNGWTLLKLRERFEKGPANWAQAVQTLPAATQATTQATTQPTTQLTTKPQ